jgi:Transcription factor WhiB
MPKDARSTLQTAPHMRAGMLDTSWMSNGSCYLSKDPRFWSSIESEIDEIRVECFQCPEQFNCFLYSIDGWVAHGIWGGYTDAERSQLRRGFAGLEAIVADLRDTGGSIGDLRRSQTLENQ